MQFFASFHLSGEGGVNIGKKDLPLATVVADTVFTSLRLSDYGLHPATAKKLRRMVYCTADP